MNRRRFFSSLLLLFAPKVQARPVIAPVDSTPPTSPVYLCTGITWVDEEHVTIEMDVDL